MGEHMVLVQRVGKRTGRAKKRLEEHDGSSKRFVVLPVRLDQSAPDVCSHPVSPLGARPLYNFELPPPPRNKNSTPYPTEKH